MRAPSAIERPLASIPTPLHHAARLSRALGVEVWLKRDDLTGVGLGGNKVRTLQYLLADAEEQGCDCLVTGGGAQSNWVMLAALAARLRGLEPHVVYYGPPSAPVGNLLLVEDYVGAAVTFTGDTARESVDRTIARRCARLRAEGRRPYLIPRGGATALGALGYAMAVGEIEGQLADAGVPVAELWLPTGSCTTQAGLVGGLEPEGALSRVIGVAVSRPEAECARRVRDLGQEARCLLGRTDLVRARDVTVLGGWIQPGYGRPSPPGMAAARRLSRLEGIFLDPVFGAKAMAAMLASADAGELADNVVFLVTGGAPTLFTAGQLAA